MELETILSVTKRQNQGGRSVAEAGPEVIEALLLDLANHSGQGPKTKELERPDTNRHVNELGWLRLGM